MRRHPLLWKMALLQVGFCVLLVWLVWSWGLQVERNTYFLEAPDRIALAAYAAEAEQVAATGDADAVERWRLALQQREHTWVAVLDDYLHSLGTTPLSAEQVSHLTFMRKLSWPMSKRLDDELPYVSIAFPLHPERGRLVMQLPERLLPPGLTPWTHVFTHGVVPVLLGISMFFQFRLNPTQMDPAQQQVFMIMPWFMMFVMAPFASGLLVYWITSNRLTIAQQKYLYSRHPQLKAQAEKDAADKTRALERDKGAKA